MSLSARRIEDGPIQPWTFDDGSDLGSYNTQALGWFTAKGCLDVHSTRSEQRSHRSKSRTIFLAQVGSRKASVIRATEQVVLPERGVMLGNFGASSITPDESWITDSEFMANGMRTLGGPTERPGRKIKWSKTNKLVAVRDLRSKFPTLGDSITKAVRPGVDRRRPFAWHLGAELRARGINAETINVGIGGEQTNQALARLDQDILSKTPTIVTIMYGTNDSLSLQRRKRLLG